MPDWLRSSPNQGCVSTFVFLLLASCTHEAFSQSQSRARHYVIDSAWMPIRVERPTGGAAGSEDQAPNVLHLRNGHILTVHLFSVEFLGQLPRAHKAPLLILGAAGCYSCDIEQQIYPVPADANNFDYGDRPAYYYPGSLRVTPAETSDTTPFYRGRMFVGRCLSSPEALVVWYEQQRDSAGHWRNDVYRLRVDGDSTRGAFLRPMPDIRATLSAVRAGNCFEVTGLDQLQY